MIRELKTFLHAKKNAVSGEYEYSCFSVDMSEFGYILVETKTTNVSFDTPEDFDPRQAHVETLQAEKAKILTGAQIMADNIDCQINSLLAIECD